MLPKQDEHGSLSWSNITLLVRECAVINRHSKRSGFVSAAGDDGPTSGSGIVDGGGGGKVEVVDSNCVKTTTNKCQHQRLSSTKRLIIHHGDVNLALSWRGSEKLYVSGMPLLVPPHEQQQQQGGVGASSTVTDDDDETDDNDGIRKRRNVNNSPLGHLLRATTTS